MSNFASLASNGRDGVRLSRPVCGRWFAAVCWCAAVAYAVILTYALLSPAPLSPAGETGRHVEFQVDQSLPGGLQHLAAYVLLMFAFCMAGKTQSQRAVRCCVMFVLGHAIAGEVLQAWVPNRHCDIFDGMANLLGIVLGGVAWMVFDSRPHRSRE